MQKLKINLFGELWTLKKVVLNPMEQEYFEQIASRLNLPLYQALLDPFFYFHLKLTLIPSLDKLPCNQLLLDTYILLIIPGLLLFCNTCSVIVLYNL